MSFLSPTFFLFFPLVSLVYFCLPARLKAPWLLLASIYFCFSAGPDSLFFLLCALAVTYGGGRALEGLSGRRRKLLLAGLLFLLFGTLFVFKYLAFALSLLARLFQAAAQALPSASGGLLQVAGATALLPELSLPAGISFYLFMAAGYLIDVYRGKVAA